MVMSVYSNLTRQSGVRAYELGADRISVRFANGAIYLYTYASTGRDEVERMKQLAQAGRGLSTYISQHVGGNYAARRQPETK